MPRTKAELAATTWPALALLLGPLIVFSALLWNLYFSHDAHLWSFTASVVLGLPLSVLLVWRASLLAKRGLHPLFAPGHRFGLRQRLAAWLVTVCVIHSLGLVLLALHLLVAGQQRAVTVVVQSSEACSRRCVSCRHHASVHGESISGSVCVEGLNPPPAVGSTVVLVGRFTEFAQFIWSVRR